MTKLIALILAVLTLSALTLASPALASEVAVSSLDLTKAVQGHWMAAVNRSTVADKNGSLPIMLDNVTYASGIGARTRYKLVIDCHGTAKRFTSIVGVHDAGSKQYDNVVFYVEGDGKLLWKSPIMKAGDAPRSIDVDLIGIR